MPTDDGRTTIETLLLAIVWHGPHAVALDHRESLRRCYREDWSAWLQIRSYLQENGMPLHEIMDCVVDQHPDECACWRCVLRLHVEIIRTGLIFNPQEGLTHEGDNGRDANPAEEQVAIQQEVDGY
jgi:hypothetical protein